MEVVESSLIGRAKRIDDAAGRYIEYCKGTFSNWFAIKRAKDCRRLC